MSEENKAIVRRIIQDVWQGGMVDAIDKYFAADFVDHNALPGMPPGRVGMKAFAGILKDMTVECRL